MVLTGGTMTRNRNFRPREAYPYVHYDGNTAQHCLSLAISNTQRCQHAVNTTVWSLSLECAPYCVPWNVEYVV